MPGEGAPAALRLLAQGFTAEVKDLEWVLRAARMRPLHGIRPQEAQGWKRTAFTEGGEAAFELCREGSHHPARGREGGYPGPPFEGVEGTGRIVDHLERFSDPEGNPEKPLGGSECFLDAGLGFWRWVGSDLPRRAGNGAR